MTTATAPLLVAMQPTFLPWLGYFALMAEADIFVFLDDVQFSKQSWQSRNRVAGPNGEVLLSLPIARKPSRPLIRDTKIADPGFADDMMARIKGSLGKAPHWPLVQDLLDRGFRRAPEGLAALNIALVEDIAALFGFAPEILRSSQLDLGPLDRASRLPAICRAKGAARYLSPQGSTQYLAEDRPFDGTGITPLFQNFTHPVYEQGSGAFLSHMSAIDALAWLGPVATGAAIRAGIGPQLGENEKDDPKHAD